MTPPAGAAARHAPAIRRGPAPRGPRRVSGPTRPPTRPHAAAGGAAALPRPGIEPGLGLRALRRVAALPEGRLGIVLDRLLTGRAWIALVAAALIGIVFVQVSLLRLNAGIGRAVEKVAALDRTNAALRDLDSRLDSSQRIQAFAAAHGLTLPPAGEITYLGRGGRRLGGGIAVPAAAANGVVVTPAPAVTSTTGTPMTAGTSASATTTTASTTTTTSTTATTPATTSTSTTSTPAATSSPTTSTTPAAGGVTPSASRSSTTAAP